MRVAAMIMAAVIVASCVSDGDAVGVPTTALQSPPPPSAVERDSATTSSVSDTGSEFIDVAPMGGMGGLAGGNPLSTIRLREGERYRFSELLPVLVFEPPNAHWEVRGYDSGAVRLRWRGEAGAFPGTLVVVVYAGRTDPADAVWGELESEVVDGLQRVGTELEWSATGTAEVGEAEAEWREFRTGSERPVGSVSSPCVVTVLGSECVWFESAARLLVVGVEDLEVPILVTEQMCDCDLGGLGRFRKDNELSEHLTLVADALSGISFDE